MYKTIAKQDYYDPSKSFKGYLRGFVARNMVHTYYNGNCLLYDIFIDILRNKLWYQKQPLQKKIYSGPPSAYRPIRAQLAGH